MLTEGRNVADAVQTEKLCNMRPKREWRCAIIWFPNAEISSLQCEKKRYSLPKVNVDMTDGKVIAQ